jgi:hypothetical protein
LHSVDAELEAFKTQIDLRQYAAANGYTLDPRESWRGSAVMRKDGRGGDKIIIKRNGNGHYVFFSVRDDADNGTIIDFVQNREGVSLGAVRKELRSWIGRPASPGLPLFQPLERTTRDRARVEAEFARMTAPERDCPYLEEVRRLPVGILEAPRFAGCARIDERGNVAFPHFDEAGLSGYELKNRHFTGFAAGGEKALWLSNESARDRRLVFCESAIECLSHAVLFPDGATRYASIGGKLNPRQPELIRAAIKRLAVALEIVAAMNADEDGRQLAGVVRAAFESVAAAGMVFTFQEPSEPHKDWNDQLRGWSERPATIPPHLATAI